VQVPAAPASSVTLTLPPATRTREVLNRFAIATRGTQALWRDGFEISHVDVRPVTSAWPQQPQSSAPAAIRR